MNDKIAILILGNRNAGKSSTFYQLFGRVIRTGYKKLKITKEELSLYVQNSSFDELGININDNIFVRNASFEEYGDEAEIFFDENHLPKIVLCAVQYKEKGLKTIEYFKNKGYYLYIQWLNPGHRDSIEYEDNLNFEKTFSKYGEFHKVSGKEKTKRVQEIRTIIINYMVNNGIR